MARALSVPADSLSTDVVTRDPFQLENGSVVAAERTTVDLQPEVRPHQEEGQPIWNALDLIVALQTVRLHLYDEHATNEGNLREYGIANFALNSTQLRAKILSDNAKEVELILKSFTMKNTRPGNSKFREIIPAASHDRNQVMVLYTASGLDPSGLVVITVDAPQVILAIEPVMCLLSFFINPAPSPKEASSQAVDQTVKAQSEAAAAKETSMSVRFDLHDVFISILEDDSNMDSQAIRLSIQHVLISQQVSGRVAL